MQYRDFLFRFYRKLRNFIVPTLRDSRLFYEDLLIRNVNNNTKWLDLGCGNKIFPEIRKKDESDIINRSKYVVGIDFDFISLTYNHSLVHKVNGDINNLPFKCQSFNMVSSNMVVEHLKYPKTQFKEINRVLCKDGLFIFRTPNLNSYVTFIGRLVPDIVKARLIFYLQGRKEDDVFTTYYRANTISKIYELARETGFKVLEIQMLVTSAQFVNIPFLLPFELLWIKILMLDCMKEYRNNIIAVMIKE